MSLLESHKNLEEIFMSKDDDVVLHFDKKRKVLSKYASTEKETKKHKKIPFTDEIYNKIF